MRAMRSGRPFVGLLAAASLLVAAPAEAKLGATIATFKHSRLIEGDTLFRYEGVVGARYRFGGAARCRFGSGLLYIDTINGTIVQQVLVLTLPTSLREEHVLQEVARLFLEDAGLRRNELKKALSTLDETLATAKGSDIDVRDDVELHTRIEPRLNSVMIVVGLKP